MRALRRKRGLLARFRGPKPAAIPRRNIHMLIQFCPRSSVNRDEHEVGVLPEPKLVAETDFSSREFTAPDSTRSLEEAERVANLDIYDLSTDDLVLHLKALVKCLDIGIRNDEMLILAQGGIRFLPRKAWALQRIQLIACEMASRAERGAS